MKFFHPMLINGEWRKDETMRHNAHLFRDDAAPATNFSRALEEIRAQAFEVQYAQLKGMMLVPSGGSFNPGAEDFTYTVFDKSGTSELAKDGQTRGPRVDVSGFQTSTKFKTFWASYGFSQQEVRAAAMSGSQLPQRKANAARFAQALKLDNALLLGSAGPDDLKVTGFVGLFTASNTTTFTASTGAAGTTFAGKTPDEIVNDLIGMENKIITDTLEIEAPDTLVLPLEVKAQMQSRMADGSDVTILKHYLQNTDNIKTVVFSAKLNSNAAWSGRRAVMYKRSNDKLEGVTSIEFSQGAPQYVGWETIVETEMRTAGTVVYFPKAICYMDGI